MTTSWMESASDSGVFEDVDALPLPLAAGTTVGGKYVVQRMIGSGGNGSVYEATHATIGHRVAIKMVHSRLSERVEVIARLGREARICGTLRHPNIGQVYDVGSHDDGVPYLVMELQEGLSLAEILKDTTLSIAAIIAIGRQLLAGLAAAHAAGVVHRDVKPDNVMVVCAPGGDVAIKLVDFGIAKQVDFVLGGKVTQRGVLVGSPDYMAPEQLRGEVVDRRTDIYGVGVLLYEALTGRMPFHGNSVADLFASILHDPIEPPTSFRRDCPPELQLTVLAALSRDPARRPPEAEQMASALALVPLDGCDAGATLGQLHERLRCEASSSAVRTWQPRVRLTTGIHPRWNEARRRLTPTALRAAVTCSLALIAVPALLAARDVTPQQPTVAARASSPRPTTLALVQQTRSAPASGTDREPPVVTDQGASALGTRAAVRASTRVRATTIHAAVDDDHGASSQGSARAELVPDQPAAHEPAVDDLLKQAATSFVRGESARARDLYLQVLAREPQRAEALRGLGLALNRMSRNAEAVRAFERYLERHGNAPDTAVVRAMLAKARAGAQADALRVAQRQANDAQGF